MRELVSIRITIEMGSPPRSKWEICCATPLSVIRKFPASRLCTMSPLELRTVTGVLTSATCTFSLA